MEYFEHFFYFCFLIIVFFSLISKFLEKSKFPVYPFYLLLFVIFSLFNIKLDYSFLRPNFDLVYDVFLPIVLFESAININIHRLKIQFKTLTFLTTVALLFNAFLFALFLFLFFKIPIQFGLIFGTLISATDPIGVLAIFKNLKIPHRLKLLIEGESMLNDATTIVFFELLIFLLIDVSKHLSPVLIVSDLILRKFLISIIGGVLLGYFLVFITRLFKKDNLLINLFTFFVVLLFYFLSENLFSLSGPIFIIFAGLIYSNFSFPIIEEEDFEKNKYVFSFLVLFINLYFFSIVGLNTDLKILKGIYFFDFLKIVLILLITRAITVYLSFFITNKHKFFFDEPDVYLSWQHIINFGGLRGVIPLILVNQLPNDFIYKNDFYNFTIYSFIFTNLINPFIVFFLIKKYQNTFYSKVFILKNKILQLEEYLRKKIHLLNDLKYFPKKEHRILRIQISELDKKISEIYKEILKEKEEDIYKSLHFLGADIEKNSFFNAYKEGKVSYFSYLRFISEIDIQVDALIYPEKFAGRVIDDKGLILVKKSWRIVLVDFLERLGFNIFIKRKQLELEKNNEYFQRVISSMRVIEKIEFFENNLKKEKKIFNLFSQIKKDHQYWIDYNLKKIRRKNN